MRRDEAGTLRRLMAHLKELSSRLSPSTVAGLSS